VQVLEQPLEIERGVAEPHVTVPGDRSAMAEQAILGEAPDAEERALAQAHRIGTVVIGRDVESVALADRPVVISGWLVAVLGPLLPQALISGSAPRQWAEGTAQQGLLAAPGGTVGSRLGRHTPGNPTDTEGGRNQAPGDSAMSRR